VTPQAHGVKTPDISWYGWGRPLSSIVGPVPHGLDIVATLAGLPYSDAPSGWCGSLHQLAVAVERVVGARQNRSRLGAAIRELVRLGVLAVERVVGTLWTSYRLIRYAGVDTPGIPSPEREQKQDSADAHDVEGGASTPARLAPPVSAPVPVEVEESPLPLVRATKPVDPEVMALQARLEERRRELGKPVVQEPRRAAPPAPSPTVRPVRPERVSALVAFIQHVFSGPSGSERRKR
jgi:hypothetical protein